ncbi:MAG: NAD(P)H-hydrate dehydratase [Bacteroidales bacterium]|nr:NAD(P)H-hydrate dehydratase [Bacteroidales bacterium]
MNKTIDIELLSNIVKRRENDSHKGDYGHLMIVAGCERMPGAAVLATGAALKSGCGLVTLHSTGRAVQAVVNNYPSAMLSEDPAKHFSAIPDLDIRNYSAIATGPGLGKEPETRKALAGLLSAARKKKIPTVLDADALNILSESDCWMKLVPEGSILTPHLGELKRLFPSENGDIPDSVIIQFCKETASVLVKKGYHTKVFTPSGECLVNMTGNPGMAKGGSGDVLTGLTGGLLARGYSPADAAAIGVWIHGYAGDLLTAGFTTEAYCSRDLIDYLWKGFALLYKD